MLSGIFCPLNTRRSVWVHAKILQHVFIFFLLFYFLQMLKLSCHKLFLAWLQVGKKKIERKMVYEIFWLYGFFLP